MVLLTLVGAFLRFFDPYGAQFGPDDVTMIGLAKGIAALQSFPTGVNSSVAIPHGPLAPYAVAPIAFFSHSQPALLAGFVAYNAAAVPLMYLLGRDLFSARAGLAAAALFAVNPWMIVFDRWLMNNALVGPTAIFLLWAAHRAARRNTLGAWALGGAAISASLQAHLSSLGNAPALIGLWPVAHVLSKRGLALAGGVALFLIVPWLAGSVWPALARLDFRSAAGSPGWSLASLEQASRLVTGGAYQAIADAPLRYLDATAPPFAWLDLLAKALAVVGWGRLVWLGWAERRDRPAVSAASFVAAFMVAVPVLALARPPEAGNVSLVYAHEFINVGPPLLLGMAGLAAIRPPALGRAATVVLGGIAAGQLLLAMPFYMTPQTEWHLGDFSVPFRFTEALVREIRERAVPFGVPVMVGGEEYAEQGKLAQAVLRLGYDRTRLHDGRDGVVFWADAARQLLVTTRDQHSMARFLRGEFRSAQVFEQELPGTRWTRRVFDVQTDRLEGWTVSRLHPVQVENAPSIVRYERAGILPPLASGDGRTVAILWRFESEPPEPFFTDLVLLRGDVEVHREEHVAYPIAFWEPGDWRRIRLLNLFDLPTELDATAITHIRIEHRGILSGRRTVPTVSFVP